MLAADYVRTHTDIASMEGANEAARHAVNAILERADSSAPWCGIWPMQDDEPAMFARAKQLDARMMESSWTRGRHAFDLIPGARATFGASGSVVDRALSLGRTSTERERSAA